MAEADDTEELLARMRKMRRELESKVEDVCDQIKLSPAQIEELLNKPETQSARQELDLRIEALETKLGEALRIKVKGASKKLQEKKQSDQRKKKMVGARRKWLEM